MTDSRLMDISDLLASYSKGNFDYEVELSPNLDEIDTIISGINMLGEELRDTTISRDFFSNIYNAVTDMLFVLNMDGTIRDTNETVKSKIHASGIIGSSFDQWCTTVKKRDEFKNIKQRLDTRKGGYTFESEFKKKTETTIYTSCTASKIINLSGEHEGYLIIAEDITERKETEKLILRTILETQDKERKRFADDLHDSLGPELSMTKLLVSHLRKIGENDAKTMEIVLKCEGILDDSIANLREICFDLMPGALEKGGILDALDQLILRVPIKMTVKTNISQLPLSKQQEVAIYRVFQEFINNSIKHSQAKKISISLRMNNNIMEIIIQDNGIGFDIASKKKAGGRGLNTMITRVESFGGMPIFTSTIGSGTKLQIFFKC